MQARRASVFAVPAAAPYNLGGCRVAFWKKNGDLYQCKTQNDRTEVRTGKNIEYEDRAMPLATEA